MQPTQPPGQVCLLPKAPNATTYQGKLCVFTSFYEYKGHAPYITSMIGATMFMERLGVPWDYWHVYGDFHFDRALNGALTRAMESDFTDIILVDSDEGFPPEAFLRLLAHDVDIVAGSYRMKNHWHEYTGEIMRAEDDGTPLGRILKDGTALLRATKVTGGFTRFRTSALRRYAEAYPELSYADKDAPKGRSVAFFYTGLVDGEFFSHDYLMSQRWRDIGIDLWIDPMIKIDHYGMQKFAGDLDAHLRNQGKTEAAFQTIADMAALIEASR